MSRISQRPTRASVKDVAHLAQVSPSTVSNFLLRPHLVSEATRARVQAAVDAMGYVPNESARQLKAGTSRTLGVVLLDAWIPYFAELSQGIDEAARSLGWALFYGNSGRDEERERANLDMFEAHRIQGLIVSPQGKVVERLEELRRRGIESVVVGPSERMGGLSTVQFDDVLGGKLAGDHLLSMGRRRIAFVGNPGEVIQSTDRLAGLNAAIRDAGFGTSTTIPIHDYTVESGMAAATTLLALPASERPDAVFAANDMVAIGVMTVLLRARVGIPTEIALVGFDDVEYARQAVIPLTSIRQPAYDMGRDAVHMLIEQIGSPHPRTARHIRHVPHLMVRASTTPA